MWARAEWLRTVDRGGRASPLDVHVTDARDRRVCNRRVRVTDACVTDACVTDVCHRPRGRTTRPSFERLRAYSENTLKTPGRSTQAL